MIYMLDAFETWLEQDQNGIYQFVRENKHALCLRLNGHGPVVDYLKSGVTYEVLHHILKSMVTILDAFDSEAIKKDRIVMYIEQFIWNEHTRTVHFVPLHVLGHTKFLSQQEVIRVCIQETMFLFLTSEQMNKLSAWLVHGDSKCKDVQCVQLEHVSGKVVIVLTHERQVIGRQEVLGNKTVSMVHSTVYIDQNREGMIMDNDSTNGTFLNGERLIPHQAYMLKKGDRIMIAEEEFMCVYKKKEHRKDPEQFVGW